MSRNPTARALILVLLLGAARAEEKRTGLAVQPAVDAGVARESLREELDAIMAENRAAFERCLNGDLPPARRDAACEDLKATRHRLVAVVAGAPPARNPATARAFRRANPCPATGRTSGACPGWVVDHRIPLCAGGPDDPRNMAWSTAADGKVKDGWERALCARLKLCEKP